MQKTACVQSSQCNNDIYSLYITSNIILYRILLITENRDQSWMLESIFLKIFRLSA